MELQERIWWREEPKVVLFGERDEPPGFDDYHVDAVCRHGIVILCRFVDEEHGERDAAQADEVIGEGDGVDCQCLHFVDEEHEED